MNIECEAYSLKNSVRNLLVNILGVTITFSGICFVSVPSQTKVQFLWVQFTGPSLVAMKGCDTRDITITPDETVNTGERD
jgi:hypothetical protein